MVSIILLIPVVMGLGCMALPTAFGQAGTPTATQTTIQGNNLPSSIEFIPQKAIITTLPPAGENIPVNNNGNSDSQAGIAGTIMAAITGAFAVYTKISSKRDHEENKAKTQDVAATQVKAIGVQQSSLELQYENMPNKGNDITNRPDIKLANVEALKAEALKNAAKA